jgi:hypothetical protein
MYMELLVQRYRQGSDAGGTLGQATPPTVSVDDIRRRLGRRGQSQPR